MYSSNKQLYCCDIIDIGRVPSERATYTKLMKPLKNHISWLDYPNLPKLFSVRFLKSSSIHPICINAWGSFSFNIKYEKEGMLLWWRKQLFYDPCLLNLRVWGSFKINCSQNVKTLLSSSKYRNNIAKTLLSHASSKYIYNVYILKRV